MYTYNTEQWLAFFVIYCFLGWVWESCYVSVRQKKWVNRGFMHGPLLPIYGSGAVIVLFAALPFKGNIVAVFLAGMISATILEYCTGAAMEAIFKVRYWDYSEKRFNLNGHICLFCSVGWGFFSIALVYVMHEPFEQVVLSIPDAVLSPVMHVVMMIAAADFALSVRTAIELRDMLVKLEAAKNELRLLQRRVEVYEAFLADDMMQKRERYEDDLKELADALRQRREALSQAGEEKRQALLSQIRSEKEELQQRYAGLHTKVSERAEIRSDIARLLKGNPGAVSVRYRLALEEFKSDIRERMNEVRDKAEEFKEKIHK